MRIAVNTENYEILNSLIRGAKEHGDTIVITKLEKAIFDHLDNGDIDAYVLRGDSAYGQKVVDYLKRYHPYIPVIIIGHEKCSIRSSDMVIPYIKEIEADFYAKAILHNIYAYTKNFNTLRRLTASMGDMIEFGNCSYDPVKRLLFLNGNKVHKLSPKQSGVFELLAANFGDIVRKDVIMERVWRTNDNYFVGRSLDVFVTHLRKILKISNINMNITSVSNLGLMLDYLPKTKK